MEHDEAIGTHAAERYALDEMSGDERERYEEHFFSCTQCALEVSSAMAFAENARSELSPAAIVQASPPRRLVSASHETWWTRLFVRPPRGLVPALGGALALLLITAGYQNLAVLPELRQQLAERDTPQVVPTVALRTAARGAGPQVLVDSSAPFVVLQADVVPDRNVPRYVAALIAPGGGIVFRTTVAAPAPGLPVTLLVPARALNAGEYTLVFTEDDETAREAGRFVFSIERL
jgi:hypothetical protein